MSIDSAAVEPEPGRVTCDTVVIGAGLAGLSCAVALVEAGQSVCVLEAGEAPGGRVRSQASPSGAQFEVGGQWASAQHTDLLGLARRYGIETFPTPHEGIDLVEWDGEVRAFDGTLGASPESDAAYEELCEKLARAAASVDLERPDRSPSASRLDSETFQTWLQRETSSKEARERLRIDIEGLCAAEVAELSALHVAFFVASNQGLPHLLETVGGAQELRFLGGAAKIAHALAAELGEALVLDSPVRQIFQDVRGVTVVPVPGTVVRAQRVVVAIPPALAGRISFEPALPVPRDALTQRMPQGCVIKGLLTYRRPFWETTGHSGMFFGDQGQGPVAMTFDNTPPGGVPTLAFFVVSRHARELEQRSEDERRQAVLDHLGLVLGVEAQEPEEYVEQIWAREPHVRGCYMGSLGPGGWKYAGPSLRTPVGRLHWAGAESATEFYGYMEGAIRSGRRAASEVLGAAS